METIPHGAQESPLWRSVVQATKRYPVAQTKRPLTSGKGDCQHHPSKEKPFC